MHGVTAFAWGHQAAPPPTPEAVAWKRMLAPIPSWMPRVGSDGTGGEGGSVTRRVLSGRQPLVGSEAIRRMR